MEDKTCRVLRFIGVFAICVVAYPLHAATDRYDYDPLGRLVRRIDDQNRATDYSYDAAGNVVRVTGAGQADPLTVTTTTIGNLRQNEIRQASISGSGLVGAHLRSSDPRVAVSNLVASANTIAFRISATSSAPLGLQTLYVENAAGSLAVGLNIVPGLPYEIVPSPISVAPDGVARLFTFRMLDTAAADMTFSVSTVSTVIARTKAAQFVVPAGQSQATFGITGLSEGTTLLRIGHSSLLSPLESLVSVSNGASSRFNFSPSVGIAKGVPWSVSPTTFTASGPIGIAKGVPWSVSPNAMTLSGPIGITKSLPWSVSPNGMTISGPIGIAKGVPWSVSPNAGPVIAPLVGISKP